MTNVSCKLVLEMEPLGFNKDNLQVNTNSWKGIGKDAPLHLRLTINGIGLK